MKIMRTLFNVAAILALSVSGYSSVQAEPEPPSFEFNVIGATTSGDAVFTQSPGFTTEVDFIGRCRSQTIMVENFELPQLNLMDVEDESGLDGLFLPGAGIAVAQDAPKCSDDGAPISSFMVIQEITSFRKEVDQQTGDITIEVSGNLKFIKPAPGQGGGTQ